MSVRAVTMYTLICDGCGKDYENSDGFTVWGDDLDARESAIENDSWAEDAEGHIFCLSCCIADEEQAEGDG